MSIHRIGNRRPGSPRAGFLLAGISALLLGACMAAPAWAQNAGNEIEVLPPAQLVVSAQVKGKHEVPVLLQSDAQIFVKKHPVQTTGWTPLQGENARMQLVILIDDSVRSYIALQTPSLVKFINALPPSAEVGIAYMDNGRAVFAQKLTADHQLAGKALRLPNGIVGVSGSPYIVLSDLAKHWPSQTKTLRRVVFMVTNGEDPYYMSSDLQDPYVDAAIADSQKAGIQVYSIYFRDRGFGGSGSIGTLYGQSYLLMVAQATGGVSYTEALSTPVSFDPFLKQFRESLDHQYLATFYAAGKGYAPVKVKSNVPGVKLSAPSGVYLPK